MELITRFSGTGTFLEIEVNEVDTIIFKNTNQPLEMIENLLSVIEDLCELTDKEFYYEIEDQE